MVNHPCRLDIPDNEINLSSATVLLDKIILRCKWNNREKILFSPIKKELYADVKLLHGKYDLIIGESFLKNKNFLEISKVLNKFIRKYMKKEVNLKSVEFAVDIPIDFQQSHSLLRLFKGLLELDTKMIQKSIAIEDSRSLKITSFSFKSSVIAFTNSPRVPIKFQVYDKTLDLSRVTRIPINKYVPVTRFELTILNSTAPFSYAGLIVFKKVYYNFLNGINLGNFNKYQFVIANQLYKNFIIEKAEQPKLSVLLFIIKNHQYFVTVGVLEIFYSYLLENKFVKSSFRSFYYKFKKTQQCSNIKFSSFEQVQTLVENLQKQLQ
jgi:hypothetical protein